MPSPVLMLALVVKGKTRPHPPVHKITLFAVMAWILPDISCQATTPVSRRFFYEDFDGILVAEPIAAGDGVVSVVIQCVSRFDYSGSATLGRNCVATHRVNLGDHGHAEIGIGLGHGNGRPQAGTAPSDQKNIVIGDIYKPRDSLRR